MGDLKAEIGAYVDEGGYAADQFNAIQPGFVWLGQRAAAAAADERLAIVLDIDDTSLSSLPAVLANNYGFFPTGACDLLPKGPCGWTGWVDVEQAPVIEPTLALYREAIDLGIAVFFITGRTEDGRAATEDNLRAAGFETWNAVKMKPVGLHVASSAEYKAPQRADIEAEGYTIVLNVGDQPSDLTGGHAERTILMPNPFYRIP